MALPLSNTFEGGTNGSAITTGNSGGASGDAFDQISASPEYDSDVAAALADGAMCMKVPAPANIQVTVGWGTASFSPVVTLYGRFYMYRTSTPAEQQRFLRWFDATSGNEGGRFSWHTDGKVYWIDNLGGSSGSSIFTIPTSTLMRVEFAITANPVTGTAEARVFQGHSTTQVTDSPYIRSNFNTGPNSVVGDMRFGNCISASPGDSWIDGVQLNSTGFPGPAVGDTGLAWLRA